MGCFNMTITLDFTIALYLFFFVNGIWVYIDNLDFINEKKYYSRFDENQWKWIEINLAVLCSITGFIGLIRYLMV